MLRGVGIDIVDVGRIRRIVERWGVHFLDKVFTQKEQDYAARRHQAAEVLAARFAAKEAFAKATGEGWAGGFRWLEVEVVHDSKGRPRLALHGMTGERWRDRSVHLSLSHTEQQAVAIVTIE